MDPFSITSILIILMFAIGYIVVIFEHQTKINKSSVALLLAVLCWVVFLFSSGHPLSQDLSALNHHVSSVSQIIFFLMGAMALVELIDSHKGFKIVTDVINTTSRRKLLWVISLTTFFLSAALDNLTTTILMVSLLRKIVPIQKERMILSIMVVVAANAGGAWTPIGDVTTTMLWIDGQLSSFSVMKALLVPSLVSMFVPLLYFTFVSKGKYPVSTEALRKEQAVEPGAKVVFALGIGGLIFVPIFKAYTGLPPFMGILLSLGILWLVTDLMHHKFDQREHLRVHTVLSRIDTSSAMFFLGILLAVDALQTAGLLQHLASWLSEAVHSLPMIASIIGVFSAVVDNVPLVAATMGMYSIETYPMDHMLWHLIAYTAGTGGSLLIIGSAAGVAMMGMEKMDFISYMKKASLPVFAGYLAGLGVYLVF